MGRCERYQPGSVAMRIAYLTSKFPCYGQTFVLNEVEANHRAGLDILTLACDRSQETGPMSELALEWQRRTVRPPRVVGQVRAALLEAVAHPRRTLSNVLWLLGLVLVDPIESLKGVKEFFTAASLAAACRNHGTQLIHVHFAGRSLSAGLMLGRLTNTPVSCTVHAFELWLRSGRNLRYRLKRCTFIATESRYHVDYMRRKCGSAITDRCHVVHCGIDVSHFDDRHRDPVPGRIVLVSRIEQQKGHRYLIEACAILKQRQVPFECILIGTGPEYKRVGKQIERLGVADCVKRIGPMANDQLRPYLHRAAVFALPAVTTSNGNQDGIPVALMEAMACGVPTISTPIAGIPELLRDGESGRLVPTRDAPALADALQNILSDRRLARRLGQAGRRVVTDQFDIRNTTRQLQRLFGKAIFAERQKQPADVSLTSRADAPGLTVDD